MYTHKHMDIYIYTHISRQSIASEVPQYKASIIHRKGTHSEM